jgi:hypothetical protein
MADTYRQLRERWKPEPVRLLLIAESAPDPGAAELRFFYAPTLTAHDNLFRGVILALDGRSPGRAGDLKRPWLQALRDDGVYLIDLVPFPVNSLASRDRKRALRDHAEECVAEAAACDPQAIAVCHGPTFDALRPALLDARLPLIHEQPLPFPLGNWREQFASGLRAAAARAGLRFHPPG